MKNSDKFKIEIIANALKHGFKKIPFIKDINKDYLLYMINDDENLLNAIIDYKKYNDFPISLLNVDWSDEMLFKFFGNSWVFLSEDDLFTKCNVIFKGLRGEIKKEEPLLYLLLKNYDYSTNNLRKLINKVPGRYMEVIDVLIDIGKPEYISLFNETVKELIRNNKEIVFEKYKDKNTVFINLAKLLNNKEEIALICEKYNHKDLENSINIDTNRINVTIDNITARKEEIDINLVSEYDQKIIFSFYDSFVNNGNKDYLRLINSYIYDSLIVNNEYARKIIEDMIKIKRINKDFYIDFDDNHASRFITDEPCGLIFNTKDLVPNTIFHEFAHAVHYYNNELENQYDISNNIEIIKSNPSEFRKRFQSFLEEYDKKSDEVMETSKEMIDKAVDESIEKYKKDHNLEESLINHAIEEEIYFQKMRKILLSEYNNKFYAYYYPQYEVLSDIFDAILIGMPHSFFDVSGHGVEYFKYNKMCTCEIIADFMSLKCLPDSEKYMDFLKEHLGEELFNIIEKGCYDALGYENLEIERNI